MNILQMITAYFSLCTPIPEMRNALECPGDDAYVKGMNGSTLRKYRMKKLGEELNKKGLIVTTVDNMPLSGWETDMYGNHDGVGNAFDFLNILKEKYKFWYKIVVPESKTLDVDGNGIMTMLSQGNADLAAAFLPVMTTFKNYIEYSRALDEGEWVVLMRRPQESATGSGLWAPFTFQVWLLILVSLILVGPVIYALILLEVRLRKDDNFPIYPLPACVWFVYGALLKQGSTLSPISDSSRMLFATWWIFITILTAFYTANLTAFLTLSKFTLPVTKPEDIGKKHYSWVGDIGSAIDQSWKIDNSTFKSKVTGSKGTLVDTSGAEILAHWVKKKNFLYLGEKPSVEYLMYNDYKNKKDTPENSRCTFVITKWAALTLPRAFAYKKGFKYYELFDDVFQHLFESGIVKYKQRENLPNTEICPLDLGSKERQLRNGDLFMTYVLVGGGFAVAAVIFILENLLSCVLKRESVQATATGAKLNNFFAEKKTQQATEKRDGKFNFANFTDNKNVKGTLWHEMKHDGNAIPPPPYHALFQPPFPNSPNGAKKNINGRDYWVVKSVYGETKLIPVRTPSALLFQYNK